VVAESVRLGMGGTEQGVEFICLYGNTNENNELRTGFFLQKRIILTVKRSEIVSDKISYVILIDSWCDIIILNVYALMEEEIS
jgi:hypothetical protein